MWKLQVTALSELAVKGSLPTPICKKLQARLVHERKVTETRDGKDSSKGWCTGEHQCGWMFFQHYKSEHNAGKQYKKSLKYHRWGFWHLTWQKQEARKWRKSLYRSCSHEARFDWMYFLSVCKGKDLFVLILLAYFCLTLLEHWGKVIKKLYSL